MTSQVKLPLIKQVTIATCNNEIHCNDDTKIEITNYDINDNMQ